MTSVTIVFDKRTDASVSEEEAKNFVDSLVEKGLITPVETDKILVNNKKYISKEDQGMNTAIFCLHREILKSSYKRREK